MPNYYTLPRLISALNFHKNPLLICFSLKRAQSIGVPSAVRGRARRAERGRTASSSSILSREGSQIQMFKEHKLTLRSCGTRGRNRQPAIPDDKDTVLSQLAILLEQFEVEALVAFRYCLLQLPLCCPERSGPALRLCPAGLDPKKGA